MPEHFYHLTFQLYVVCLVIAHVVKQNVCSTGMDQSNRGSHKSYKIFLLFLLMFIDYCSARICSCTMIKIPFLFGV